MTTPNFGEMAERLSNAIAVCIETSHVSLGGHAPEVDFEKTFCLWIESALRDAYEQGEKAGLNVNVSPMVHEAYLKGAEQMRERAAKLMEEYGCTACNHFGHDASPILLRDIPIVEEETKCQK